MTSSPASAESLISSLEACLSALRSGEAELAASATGMLSALIDGLKQAKDRLEPALLARAVELHGQCEEAAQRLRHELDLSVRRAGASRRALGAYERDEK